MQRYCCYFLDSSESNIGFAVLSAHSDKAALAKAADLAEGQPDHVTAWSLYDRVRCVRRSTQIPRDDTEDLI